MGKPFTLSAKAVIRDEEGRCLILKRSRTSRGNPGRWDFPGGKVETGERFEESLAREIREETGLEVSIGRVVGHAQSESPDAKIAYIILEARSKAGTVTLSEEHEEYRWIDVASLGSVDLCPQFTEFANYYASSSTT